MMDEVPQKPLPSRVRPGASRLMIAIVIALALLALYANVQRNRRDKLESVTITRPSPTATP